MHERYVDPKTGGEKEVKLIRFDLVPPHAIMNWLDDSAVENAVRWWAKESGVMIINTALQILKDKSDWRLLAELYGYGVQKYAERNWERGYPWSLSFAALMRHATALEDIDDETHIPHRICVAWHAIALSEFERRKIGTDDRV